MIRYTSSLHISSRFKCSVKFRRVLVFFITTFNKFTENITTCDFMVRYSYYNTYDTQTIVMMACKEPETDCQTVAIILHYTSSNASVTCGFTFLPSPGAAMPLRLTSVAPKFLGPYAYEFIYSVLVNVQCFKYFSNTIQARYVSCLS